MAEQKSEDLERQVKMLDLRIRSLIDCFELQNVQCTDLRMRMDSLEEWRDQVMQNGNFASDGRNLIPEMTTNCEGVSGAREGGYPLHESTTFKCEEQSETEVESLIVMVENVGEQLTDVLLEFDEEEIQEFERSLCLKERREEDLEESAKQEKCVQLNISENLRKMKQNLNESTKNEEHFGNGTALVEFHTFRESDGGEGNLEGTVERMETEAEFLGKGSNYDIRMQGSVRSIQLEETGTILNIQEEEKHACVNDGIGTGVLLSGPKYFDCSELHVVGEAKGEKVGKEAHKQGEVNRVEMELDECGKNSESLTNGEEMLESGHVDKVREENGMYGRKKAKNVGIEEVNDVRIEEAKDVGKEEGNDVRIGEAKDVGKEEGNDVRIGEAKDVEKEEAKDVGIEEVNDVRIGEAKYIEREEGKDIGIEEAKDIEIEEAKDIEIEEVNDVEKEEVNCARIEEGKDVGIEKQVDKFAKKSRELFQLVETGTVGNEADEIRLEEGCTDDLKEAYKIVRVSETLNLESESESGLVHQEFAKFEKNQTVFVKGKEEKRSSEDVFKNHRPLEVLQDLYKLKCETKDLIEEAEKMDLLMLSLHDFDKQSEEEEEQKCYALELAELEECFRAAELNTPDQLEKWYADELRTRDVKVVDALRVIIKGIEREMDVSLPVGLRKKIGECVMKLTDSSHMDLKQRVVQLETLLLSETRIRHSFQGEIRRLYKELTKKVCKKDLFNDKLHEVNTRINTVITDLEISRIAYVELCKKYNVVTLNIEAEMKRHRQLVAEYGKLKIKCDNMQTTNERLSRLVEEYDIDVDEVETETSDAKEYYELVVSPMEKGWDSLLRSLSEVRDVIMETLDIPSMVRGFKMEMVDSSEALDECRRELLRYMKDKPMPPVRLIEQLLTKHRNECDYFWKGVLDELNLSLHKAAEHDCPLLTSVLLGYGAKRSAVDKKGNTALHVAAIAGSAEVCKVLLNAGCVVNATNSSQHTPLYLSLYHGHVNFSLLLIWAGANLHLRGAFRVTPLHLAVLTKNLPAVHALVQADAVVNATDADGDTPLFNAAVTGDVQAGETLVRFGADVGVMNSVGNLPIHAAAWEGNLCFCSFLLNNGSAVDPINFHNVTPLHLAAMENHALIVQLFINRGAKVNALEESVDSPLHYAAKFGNLPMVESLVVAGADIFATNLYKWTPLHCAAAGGNRDVCLFLLRKKADVNAEDVKGRTPLHVVAMYAADIATAKCLIVCGADMTAVDMEGSMPSDLAIDAENLSFLAWLEDEIDSFFSLRRKQQKRKKGLKH